MGIDVRLISTDGNGLRVPLEVKCCFCWQLLDDGISLSGCGHNACYQCMRREARRQAPPFAAVCPLDSQPFNASECRYLCRGVTAWLRDCRVKCRWFDGHRCTATRLALHNVTRHEGLCPARQPIKSGRKSRSRRQLGTGGHTDGDAGSGGPRMANKFRQTESSANAMLRSDQKFTDEVETTSSTAAMDNRMPTDSAPAVRPTLKYNTKLIEEWIRKMTVTDDSASRPDTNSAEIVDQKPSAVETMDDKIGVKSIGD